jgi:hypothetical protein
MASDIKQSGEINGRTIDVIREHWRRKIAATIRSLKRLK